jgi:hypothetical protein
VQPWTPSPQRACRIILLWCDARNELTGYGRLRRDGASTCGLTLVRTVLPTLLDISRYASPSESHIIFCRLTYAPLANAIFEGARNARGGERQFAAGRGLAESNLHLFEPVQLLL